MTWVHCYAFHLHRNRIIPKRINLRIEHIQQSRCREDFLRRVKENEQKKRIAKEKNEPVLIACFVFIMLVIIFFQIPKGALKRQPKSPCLRGHFVIGAKGEEPTLVEPIPYAYTG